MVNLCCSENPLLCRGPDRAWGSPGWAGSPLAAVGWGVCAQPVAVPGAKTSPKLGLADRRGVAVFQEEMRNHFTSWTGLRSDELS